MKTTKRNKLKNLESEGENRKETWAVHKEVKDGVETVIMKLENVHSKPRKKVKAKLKQKVRKSNS
jgi:hypothetical protein